jgi:hypothetical protein
MGECQREARLKDRDLLRKSWSVHWRKAVKPLTSSARYLPCSKAFNCTVDLPVDIAQERDANLEQLRHHDDNEAKRSSSKNLWFVVNG